MQLTSAPYSDTVKSLLRFNPTTSFYIYCGKSALDDARASIKNAVPCLCLPFGRHPDNYRWFVDSGSFILYDTGGMAIDFLTDFSLFLLANGAKQILLFTEIAQIQLFTQKDLLS